MHSEPIRSLPAGVTRAAVVALLLLGLVLGLVSALASPPAARADAPGTGARTFERTYRVITLNTERRPDAARAAIRRALDKHVDVVLLQEVCTTTFEQIRDAHPTWTVGWTAGSALCPPVNAFTTTRSPMGDVAIWTGGPNGLVSRYRFNHQAVLKRQHMRTQAGMVCVAYSLRHRACSTHLVATNQKVAAAQAREVRRITSSWINRGQRVIVGGDFNAKPDKRVLNYLYAEGPRAKGRFFEVSGRGHEPCRCGRWTNVTRPAGKKREPVYRKIDYIFVSDTWWSPESLATISLSRSSPRVKRASDHRMLSASITLPR